MRQASTNFHAGAFKGTGGMHAIMEVEDAPEDANYYFSCHQEEQKRQDAHSLQNSPPGEGNANNYLENDETASYSNLTVNKKVFKSYVTGGPNISSEQQRRDSGAGQSSGDSSLSKDIMI